MKKTHIIVAVLFMVFTIIFISREKDKEPVFVFDPADSGIYYESGAMHEEWGKSTFEILKGGNSTYNKYQDLELKETHTFETSDSELAKILNVAGQNGFLSFNDEYEDPAIMDGGYDIITIYYGNNSKTVTLKNYNLLEFSLVESEILKLFSEKIGKVNF